MYFNYDVYNLVIDANYLYIFIYYQLCIIVINSNDNLNQKLLT